MQKLLVKILLCFALFNALELSAQSPLEVEKGIEPLAIAESLIVKTKGAPVDTSLADLFNQIAYQYRRNDPFEGIAYSKKALDLSRQLNWNRGTAEAYDNLGHCYLTNSDYPNALASYKSCLAIAEITRDSTLSTIANLCIGEVYYHLSKYKEAQEFYFIALNIAEKQQNKTNIIKAKINIGDIYKAENNTRKALEYYNAGLSLSRESKDVRALAVVLRNIGTVFFEQSNFAQAEAYYNQSLEIARSARDNRIIAENFVSLGNVYSEQNDHGKAVEYISAALNLNKSINNKSGIANNLGNLGTTYLLMGIDEAAPASERKKNLTNGINYLEQAVQIVRQLGELKSLPQFYENLSDAYALLGQYKKAYETHLNYIEYKDSVFNQRHAKEMMGRELEYEFNKQKDSIRQQKLLTEERLKSEQQSRKHDQIFYVSGIVVMILVSLFIFRSLRTQRRLNETITRLVNEQEKTIEVRTLELSASNAKLREIISFNAHQIREPLTRITGAMHVREYVEQQEFFDDFLPLMEKAANDLDNAIKNVLEKAQVD